MNLSLKLVEKLTFSTVVSAFVHDKKTAEKIYEVMIYSLKKWPDLSGIPQIFHEPLFTSEQTGNLQINLFGMSADSAGHFRKVEAFIF